MANFAISNIRSEQVKAEFAGGDSPLAFNVVVYNSPIWGDGETAPRILTIWDFEILDIGYRLSFASVTVRPRILLHRVAQVNLRWVELT